MVGRFSRLQSYRIGGFVGFLSLICFSLQLSYAFARSQNCRNPVSCDENTDYFTKNKRIAIEYAIDTIRDVAFSNTYVDFTGRGLGEDEFYKYRIVVCGCPLPESSGNRIVLYSNPSSLYINESPALALLHFLEPKLESLTYVNTADYIYTPAIRERVAREEAKEIMGSDFQVDYSLLQKDDSLSGSLIGTFTAAEYKDKVKDVPFMVVGESSESSPLARAEWMKVIGLYLGLSDKANDRFERVVNEYEKAKRKAFEAERRPSVLLNYPVATGSIDLSKGPDDNYKWYLPHRDQYTTDIINDANADYRYAKTDSSMTLAKSISEVVKDFGSARYLLLAGAFPADSKRDTLEEFVDAFVSPFQPDNKAKKELQKLSSLRCGQVWGREKRISEDGMANDYFESGIFQPDEVLKDLVTLLHPTVDFGNRETVYMNWYKPASDKFTKNCPYKDFSVKPEPGTVYVDHSFSVSNIDRFQVEDLWEPKVRAELNELNLPAEFDIMFRPENADAKTTKLVLRGRTEDGRENKLEDWKKFAQALERSLGTEVVRIEESKEERKGGLSGVAIAFIVIGVLLILSAIGFALWRRRQNKNQNRFPIQRLPETKGQVWAESRQFDADHIGVQLDSNPNL